VALLGVVIFLVRLIVIFGKSSAAMRAHPLREPICAWSMEARKEYFPDGGGVVLSVSFAASVQASRVRWTATAAPVAESLA